MSEIAKYRISFVVRDKTTNQVVKERILEEGKTKKQVLKLYSRYLKMFSEKTPGNVEKLRNPGWEYSLEIKDEKRILSQIRIFQKNQHP
jgi:hypothetical protein